MKRIRLIIGADHRGFMLKTALKEKCPSIIWHDIGTHSLERVDYPDIVEHAVSVFLSESHTADGYSGVVLLCSNGIGMSIAANRYRGMYAGLIWNEQVARSAKQDDNCNILVLPAEFLTPGEAEVILFAWIEAQFKGGRYAERLAKVDLLF